MARSNRANKKIKVGSTVKVLIGKDRNKTGKVLKILSEVDRAVVEKIKMVKRHQKGTEQNPQGQIVEKESSIHLSNLVLADSGEASSPTVKTAAPTEKKKVAKKTAKKKVAKKVSVKKTDKKD